MAGYAANLRPLPDSSLDPDSLEVSFAQATRGPEGGYYVGPMLLAQQQRMARGDMLLRQNAQTNAVSAALAQRELENARLGHLTQLAGTLVPLGGDPLSLVGLRPEFGASDSPEDALAATRANRPMLVQGQLSSMFRNAGSAANDLASAGIDPTTVPILQGARRQAPTSVQAASVGASGANRERVQTAIDSAGNVNTTITAPTTEANQRLTQQAQGATAAQQQRIREMIAEGSRRQVMFGNPRPDGQGNFVVPMQRAGQPMTSVIVDMQGNVRANNPNTRASPAARQ